MLPRPVSVFHPKRGQQSADHRTGTVGSGPGDPCRQPQGPARPPPAGVLDRIGRQHHD